MGSLPPSFIVPVLSVVDPHPHQALDPHECASFCKPGSASGSASTTNKNPDPDPHQIKIRIQTRLRVISQIWVLIKVMRIHNTAGIDPDFCLGQTTLYLGQGEGWETMPSQFSTKTSRIISLQVQESSIDFDDSFFSLSDPSLFQLGKWYCRQNPDPNYNR
jgi:hypothetical protein